MKIVVLDGYALNPGDLSWESFDSLGTVTVYPRTSNTDENEVITRIGNAQIVLTNKTIISESILAACPSIQYIGELATGYNNIDLDACKKRGIPVSNIPSYSTKAVAQFTFAFILQIFCQISAYNESVQAGDWQNCKDFTYQKFSVFELAGKTLGLIGYGSIAQAVAKIAKAFDMRVIYYNHREKNSEDKDIKQVPLDVLYAESDVLSLHIPLFDTTKHLIDSSAITKMKDGVVLINTARGPLIDEYAVTEALKTGKIKAAGLDVVSVEPIEAMNPLLQAPNCYITPHIAWKPNETRTRLMQIAVENLKAFLEGSPINRIV